MKQLLLLSCSLLLFTTARAQIRIYPLDGNALETVGGFDGTLGAGTAEPSDTTDRTGTPSGALYFNGDDHIEIPVGGLTNPEFSVSAWVLVSANPGTLQMDYFAVGDAAEDQAFGVANDQFGQGFFQAGYVDAGNPVRVFADTLPAEDTWIHVVVTRSSTELKLFIDGWPVASTPTVGTLPSYGAAPLAFIGNRNANLRPWNGIIDDLRIWDRALSDVEVQGVNAVAETSAGTGALLFPNPADEALYISTPQPMSSTMNVLDITGRVVLSQPINGVRSTVHVDALAPGPYIAQFTTTAGACALRFVKR